MKDEAKRTLVVSLSSPELSVLAAWAGTLGFGIACQKLGQVRELQSVRTHFCMFA